MSASSHRPIDSLFRQGFQYIHIYIYIYIHIYENLWFRQTTTGRKHESFPLLALSEGNLLGTYGLPSKMTVKSKSVSMLWRHHNHASMGQPHVNILRQRQNGRHFADDIFKRMFLNENIWIPIEISLKFVPKGSIDNIPALMVNLPTQICTTRPQWVKIRYLPPVPHTRKNNVFCVIINLCVLVKCPDAVKTLSSMLRYRNDVIQGWF